MATFLKAVIKIGYWFILPKLVEDGQAEWQIQQDAHTTCRWTVPTREMSTKEWEGILATSTFCEHMRVLRAHGMDDSPLQTIYRSVIISKLTYASSAWWEFTSAADRQRLEAFISRSHRIVVSFHPTYTSLCRYLPFRWWEIVFCRYKRQRPRVRNLGLHKLLPPLSTASQSYNLRERKHNRKQIYVTAKIWGSVLKYRYMHTQCQVGSSVYWKQWPMLRDRQLT